VTLAATWRRDKTFDGFGGRAVDLTRQLKTLKELGAGDLELINSFALKTLTAEDVAVYVGKIANNQIDRDEERFSEEVLADFAASLPGKSLLEGHRWGPTGLGRFFKAWMQEDDETGVTWLMASFYLPRGVQESDEMIRKIDTGAAWAMSIGFFAPDRIVVTGREGERLFAEYRRGGNGEKAEAIEASMVFLGAQFDASVVQAKAANRARVAKGKEPLEMTIDPKRKSLLEQALDLVRGKGRVTVERVGDVERASIELDGGTVSAELHESCPEGCTHAAGAKDCKNPAAPEAAQEDEPMTKEERDALLTEIKSLITDGLAPLQGELAEVKAAVAQHGEKVTAVADRLEKIEGAVDEAEQAIEKSLERLEGVESVFGMPRAEGGEATERPASERPAETKGKKVFGDMIIPSDRRKARA
jgi:hypothetical protein